MPPRAVSSLTAGDVFKRPAAAEAPGSLASSAAKRPASMIDNTGDLTVAKRASVDGKQRSAADVKQKQRAAAAAAKPRAAVAAAVQRSAEAQPRAAAPLARKRPAVAVAPESQEGNTLRIPEVTEVPTVFEFDTDAEKAYGLFIDEKRCMMGDEEGLVIDVDRRSGKPLRSFRLPGGVRCIVGDGSYLYVGTNDGDIFDLSSGRARLVAKIEGFGALLWIDIRDGLIAASDQKGNVGLLNCEGEVVWQKHSGGHDGWLCRIDSTGIYHGCSNGVRKYDLKGQLVWTCPKRMDVTFGVQTDNHLWVMAMVSRKDSPEQTMVAKIRKDTGALDGKMQFAGIDSCCVSTDLKRVYDSRMNIQPANVQLAKWAGAAWKACTLPVDTILSMQAFGNHVYAVGSRPKGSKFCCFDVSDEGIMAAAGGSLLPTRTGWGAADRAQEQAVATTVKDGTSTEGKVVIGCITDGSKLRARVESPGYDPTLNVQFPCSLREAGRRYTVDAVELAPNGGFYRTQGEIRHLVEPAYKVVGGLRMR